VAGRPNPEHVREAWEREVDRLEVAAGVELDEETRETVVRELLEEQPRGPRTAGRARRLAVVRAAGEIKARERSLRSEMNKRAWRERRERGEAT
jgi:hypothetical protein